MKKKLLALVVGLFCLTLSGFLPVFQAFPVAAQENGSPKSLIPEETPGVILDCVKVMGIPDLKEQVRKNSIIDVSGLEYDVYGKPIDGVGAAPARDTALTCGIKSGRIPLWLIPFYIVRVIDFLLFFGGLISVLFMVIGGYHMIIGSYSEEKENGKNTIKYAIFGLVVTLLAYTVVTVVMLFLTS
jgi:hypothetical protein